MHQQPFDFESTRSYSLFAQPDRSGFFGLSQLQSFAGTALEPYRDARIEKPLILDFSLVKIWDISALLWLVIGLHHYRQAGMSFLLKLPEGDPTVHSDHEVNVFNRSADYLRRWGFKNALLNLSPDPASLLVKEQREFFTPEEPRQFFRERTVLDESGLLQTLISRRLVHIRNLAELTQLGPSTISNDRITECIVDFQSARMGDILHAQCGVPKRDADLFAEHLLTEALLNVREHPQASIGMIAISLMGNTNELILTVADNGDSIASTIFEVFAASQGQVEGGESKYNKADLLPKVRAEVIDFATQAGVTRKKSSEELNPAEHGMGLTYIKEDTVDTFHGKLRIITDGVAVKYGGHSADKWDHDQWEHSWRGNLLRIAIPLTLLTH